MTIWSRIKESVAALTTGQPLSAVFDRLGGEPEHSVAFAIAVIALGAKMAKADGRVTPGEIAAFRRVFTIPPEGEEQAARIYNLARTDVAGFDGYARRIRRMFKDDTQALRDLLEGLCYIAAADGHYHPGEEEFLAEVARIFRIDEAEFRCIRARHISGECDPYAVLGLEPGATPEQIRSRYRQLVRDLHPDRMMARGLPGEATRLAEQRLASINDAYDSLRPPR